MVPILIGFGIWTQVKMKRTAATLFKEFNAATIDGTLEEVGYFSKSTAITFDDGKVYVFLPYTNTLLNKNKVFEQTAKKGDRVIKPAFSDTLYLYSASNQKLKYTFAKNN